MTFHSSRHYLVMYLVVPHLLISFVLVLGATLAIRLGSVGQEFGALGVVAFVVLWILSQLTVCRLPAVVQVGDLGYAKSRTHGGYAGLLAVISLALSFLLSAAYDSLGARVKQVSFVESDKIPVESSDYLRVEGQTVLSATRFVYEERGSRFRKYRGSVETVTVFVGAHIPFSASCVWAVDTVDVSETFTLSQARADAARIATADLKDFADKGGHLRPLREPIASADNCFSSLVVTDDPKASFFLYAFFSAWFLLLLNIFPLVGLLKQPNPSVVAALQREPSFLRRLFFMRPRWA